jgi:cob(I)alamin adenosyltransferase
MRSRQNFLHLYIGEGKGKTTSAVGMAIRAAGWNWSVLFCQFLKSADTGELMIMKGLKDRITLFRPAMRHKGFLWNQTPQQLEETRADLKQGLNQIMEMVENQSFDMIVMDELLDVLHTGLIPESHICSLIYQNPSEWVLTGRTASETLMNQADYITRMEPVRHPFQKGLKARQGIEY